MKSKFLYLSIILFLIITFIVPAQELSEEQMREIMEQMQPGEEHAMLKQFEGEWTMQFKSRMAMDKEPVVTSGDSKIEMILGDRFMKWTSSGEVMDQIIENLTIIGFDKRFKKYTFYGFDTMGTYGVSAEGDMDPESKIIVFEGINYEPAFDKESKYQMKFDASDKDKINFSVLFEKPDGNEYFPIVEIRGERKK